MVISATFSEEDVGRFGGSAMLMPLPNPAELAELKKLVEAVIHQDAKFKILLGEGLKASRELTAVLKELGWEASGCAVAEQLGVCLAEGQWARAAYHFGMLIAAWTPEKLLTVFFRGAKYAAMAGRLTHAMASLQKFMCLRIPELVAQLHALMEAEARLIRYQKQLKLKGLSVPGGPTRNPLVEKAIKSPHAHQELQHTPHTARFAATPLGAHVQKALDQLGKGVKPQVKPHTPQPPAPGVRTGYIPPIRHNGVIVQPGQIIKQGQEEYLR